MQKSLGELQQSLTNFISTFPQPREVPPSNPDVLLGASTNTTPQCPARQPGEVLHTPVTAGYAVLHDFNTGKELQLDGSSKAPYRHPHFSQNKQVQTALETRLAQPTQQ